MQIGHLECRIVDSWLLLLRMEYVHQAWCSIEVTVHHQDSELRLEVVADLGHFYYIRSHLDHPDTESSFHNSSMEGNMSADVLGHYISDLGPSRPETIGFTATEAGPLDLDEIYNAEPDQHRQLTIEDYFFTPLRVRAARASRLEVPLASWSTQPNMAAAMSPSTSPRLPSPPPIPEVQIGPQSPGINTSSNAGHPEAGGSSTANTGAADRIRPGTRAADMAAGPPLVPLEEVSPFTDFQRHRKA